MKRKLSNLLKNKKRLVGKINLLQLLKNKKNIITKTKLLNLLKNKKILISTGAVLLIGVMSMPLLLKSENEDEVVREREYVVKKDSITVGVESSGVISTIPNIHSFPENTVVGEIFVKPGNEVRKGDKLATISLENLKELIQTTKDELSDSRAALLQVSSSKDLLLSQNDKNKQDATNNVQQEFNAKIELLNSEKNKIEKNIQEHESEIEKIEKQISGLVSQVGDVETKISKLKTEINKNIIKIGELNEKLLQVDDGSDRRSFLNQKISNAQSQIQSLNNQLSDKLSLAEKNKSYIENLKSKNEELEQKIKELEDETQIATLQQEINNNNIKINQLSFRDEIDEIKNKILIKEKEIKDAQTELLNLSDGSSETNSIRLEITKLQNKNTTLQQEIDKLYETSKVSDLEKLRNDKSVREESLKTEYTNFSLKLEETQRTEDQHKQSLENQNKDNVFADYKVNEELKSINENISKENRKMKYAQEKINKLYDLERNPTLYAKMDGIVTSLNYKIGEALIESKPFCVIGELHDITMTVPVSAADIGSISIDQKVNIYVDAFAEQKFNGVVTERLLVANDNGDYEVTISLETNDYMLLPGMKAFATIILKEKNDILTISNKAIFVEDGQQYVNVKKENGEIEKKKVITGFSDGRVSEVLNGLVENNITVVKE